METLFHPTIPFRDFNLLIQQDDVLQMINHRLRPYIQVDKTRFVAASFMIVHYPANLFESIQPLEQRLLDAATNFIARFEQVCNGAEPGNFVHLYNEYMSAFFAWQAADKKKLLLRAKHGMHALLAAQSLAPTDARILESIKKLREKLMVLGGQQALAEFDNYPTPAPQQHPAEPIMALTNEQLAHELMIDPSFRLSNETPEGCAGGLGMVFQNAFWNCFSDDLRLNPASFSKVTLVVTDVEEVVHYAENNTTFNLQIEQRIKEDQFGWADCGAFISAILSKLQEIASSPELRNLLSLELQTLPSQYNPDTFISALKILNGFIHKIRIQQANERLEVIAPVIENHGIVYERSKFEQKLASNEVTLEKTTSWLQATARSDMVERPCIPQMVHNQAMMTLIVEPPKDQIPETLIYDRKRLYLWNKEFHYQVRAIVCVITAERIYRTAPHTAMAVYFADIDCDDVVRHTMLVLGNVPDKERFKRILETGLQPSNAVYQVVVKRLRSYWLNVLEGQSIAQNNILFEMATRVHNVATTVAKIARLNRDIYQPYYDRIVSDINSEHESSAGNSSRASSSAPARN